MRASQARHQFDSLFCARPCDRALTSAARYLISTTGANGNLFPILDRLAALRGGQPAESTLDDSRPQDIALLLGFELIRLNDRRMFVLNATVDPSRLNGRLVNWADAPQRP